MKKTILSLLFFLFSASASANDVCGYQAGVAHQSAYGMRGELMTKEEALEANKELTKDVESQASRATLKAIELIYSPKKLKPDAIAKEFYDWCVADNKKVRS